MSTPLTTNEKLTLYFALAALTISLLSIYFQFFYISDKITASKLDAEFPINAINGSFSLRIGLINNGNKNVAIVDCTPEIQEMFVQLSNEPKFPFILKTSEIILLEYNGIIDYAKFADGKKKSSDDYRSGEFTVNLNFRVVGAKGFDKNGKKKIGSITICSIKGTPYSFLGFCGWDFLRIPVTLN